MRLQQHRILKNLQEVYFLQRILSLRVSIKLHMNMNHVRPNLLWIPEVEKKYLLALWARIRASLHLIRTFADHGYRHHRRQPIRLPFL